MRSDLKHGSCVPVLPSGHKQKALIIPDSSQVADSGWLGLLAEAVTAHETKGKGALSDLPSSISSNETMHQIKRNEQRNITAFLLFVCFLQ